jgi:acetyl-CoA carboxylase biotin carboxylase subunit
MITGLDLVTWQILIAAGVEIDFDQKSVQLNGHAVECRINAENPDADFRPAAGTVEGYLAPGGPGVRVDSHLYPGYVIPANYDSLLAKIIAWGPTRAVAIVRLERALAETLIAGVDTTIPFVQRVLRSQDFRTGAVSTRLVGDMIRRSDGVVDGEQGMLAPSKGEAGSR